MATFFQPAPSRDDEEMNAVAWSFTGRPGYRPGCSPGAIGGPRLRPCMPLGRNVRPRFHPGS
ncbi:MAG: hypothetical protein JO281_01650 [Pseudonocardiales bacterium]|nr:hypothetical protein [Pseudonocardiales bacterium]